MTQSASRPADSSPFEGSTDRTTRSAGSSLTWARRFASEPFVHFTLLGALVFAGHRLLTPKPHAPSIDVSTSKQRELTKLFEQWTKRTPNEAERKQLLQRYVEDEALFREGLRLSLVQTDPVLRGQVIARVRSLLQSERDHKPPTDSELQLYFEAHRSDYATPETISYREYWIQRGPEAGADARRLMQALRAEKQPDEGLPPASDYSARSEAQLVSFYDQEVAHELWTLPNASWHELRSERGTHIVRVNQHAPASQPSFADIREQVSASYRKAEAARAVQAELTRLTSRWRVNVAEAP